VVDEHHRQVPHELGDEEIAELVRAFGHAARRVRDGGMDGVEVHAGHFYLINQFLSPYTNHRTDRYGGSWENRSRFLSEVLDAIRSHAGAGFPIGIRINGEEFVEGGLTLDDMKRVAQDLEGRVAYLSVSGGTYTGLKKGIKMAYVSPWFVPPGPMVPYAAEIKKVVKTPVMVVGRINDPEQAERIIAEGYADMVGMTRALIADPEFPKKARDGRAREIRKCIGTNECHYAGRPIACTINAAAGREEELALHPAPVRRRLLVIGGGPAGMEAARVAALRGHRVVLCERRMRLGGQMAIVARDPNREQVAGFLEYLQRQVEEAGVEVRLGVEVTPEMVAGLTPDAVVVATGSRPYVPPAPGMDQKNVVTAAQVLEGEVKAGRRVLVVGGLEEHMPPLGIAEFLADQGKRVEVLSELLVAGEGLETTLLHVLTKRLLDKGITLTPLTAVEAVRGRTVLAANSFTGQRRTITGVDTVVLACGSRADDTLARALKSRAGELHLIGDCRAPRRMLHAIMEGARAASLV
jgi:thioredoxin reductase